VKAGEEALRALRNHFLNTDSFQIDDSARVRVPGRIAGQNNGSLQRIEGGAQRPDSINLRRSDFSAVRAPYSRATSCLRTRVETDPATVVLGSQARRTRRAHPANARDETESRRRINPKTHQVELAVLGGLCDLGVMPEIRAGVDLRLWVRLGGYVVPGRMKERTQLHPSPRCVPCPSQISPEVTPRQPTSTRPPPRFCSRSRADLWPRYHRLGFAPVRSCIAPA
jgi:hypothetical protein